MRAMWKKASKMAEATPPGRDRYVDFLRVVSITVVVLGHWLMAVVWIENGDLRISHLLVEAPSTQYLTWVLQVMPVFFIVGGFANTVSWDSACLSGRGYSGWLQARTARLLRPTVAFAAIWTFTTIALTSAGVETALLKTATQVVAVPLWFLAVYLGVVALAPAMISLDRRFGWSVPAVVLVSVAAIDWLTHGVGLTWMGPFNFLAVWLGIHQIGVRWSRGFLPEGLRSGTATALCGLLAMSALTIGGPYPVSMVGVPGAGMTNTLPPTVALMALAVFQTGLIVVFRNPVSRWLDRRKVWSAVIVGNGRIMTVYLWHMSAMIAVFGGLLLFGRSALSVEPLTGTWWLSRLLWIGVLGVLLVALIGLFGRLESGRSGAPRRATALVSGMAVVIWALARLALGGFVDPAAAAVEVVAPVALAGGAWLLAPRRVPSGYPVGHQSVSGWVPYQANQNARPDGSLGKIAPPAIASSGPATRLPGSSVAPR